MQEEVFQHEVTPIPTPMFEDSVTNVNKNNDQLSLFIKSKSKLERNLQQHGPYKVLNFALLMDLPFF